MSSGGCLRVDCGRQNGRQGCFSSTPIAMRRRIFLTTSNACRMSSWSRRNLQPPTSPIYGDGVHGRNPNPGHLLSVVNLETRKHVTDIDLSPYVAPHGLQIGPDGPALHHLREQWRGRACRSRRQCGRRRNRKPVSVNSPSPCDRTERAVALYRERRGRLDLGDRPAGTPTRPAGGDPASVGGPSRFHLTATSLLRSMTRNRCSL